MQHGMVDMVIHRHEMRDTLARLCHLLMREPVSQDVSDEAVDAKSDGAEMNGHAVHVASGANGHATVVASDDDAADDATTALEVDATPDEKTQPSV